MNTTEEKDNQLDKLQIEIDELTDKIENFELDASEYEDSYDDMLNDCYPELFNMQPARILAECDPIAYRCGLSDYVDSLELSDSTEYTDMEEKLEELTNELEEIED